MNCPICKVDLSPLDFVSKTEHVDLCIENGPTVLDFDGNGRAVIRRNVPPNKQRKICPICDKTFQSIHLHYKKCALKNDVLPDLMLDHWDQFNKDANTCKKFPRDLLENFINRRVREGRSGEQVEYAKGLLLSMTESEPNTANTNGSLVIQQPLVEITVDDSDTNQSAASVTTNQQQAADGAGQQIPACSSSATVEQALMQSARDPATTTKVSAKAKPQKKFRIELVDDVVKRVHINLRRERELAASTERRFRRIEEAIDEQAKMDGGSSQHVADQLTINWLDRLT